VIYTAKRSLVFDPNAHVSTEDKNDVIKSSEFRSLEMRLTNKKTGNVRIR
jgi:hypothetical protein